MKFLLFVVTLFVTLSVSAAPQTVTFKTSSNRTYTLTFDPVNKYAGAVYSLKETKVVTTTSIVRRKNVTTTSTVNDEWVNSYDAGRLIQTALHTNERGECYNPTQGGNWTEIGRTYVSKALNYWVTPTSFHTETQMAYWLRPGDTRTPQPGYCPTGKAENTTKLSNYVVTHDVNASDLYGAMVLTYDISVTTPEPNNSIVFETLTGYMTSAFSTFYKYDSTSKTLLPGPTTPNEQTYPIVLSANSTKAIGIYCEDGANYSAYNFVKLAGINTMKFNAVHRTAYSPPGVYATRCYVPVGSVTEVKNALGYLVP
jgi:hypothetical protein